MYAIRANYTRDTITMYQAYSEQIAKPALRAQTFVAPFSTGRMTWIKPSFNWLMHRSAWGTRKNQEHILAVEIKLEGWLEALGAAVLTEYVPGVHASREQWREAFERARVHVQWDTERSARGAALDHYSIQVGLSRHIIDQYVEEWIVGIQDMTPAVRKIRRLTRAGKSAQARRAMPTERDWSAPVDLRHLRIT